MNMRHAKFCHDDPYNRSLNSDCTNATYQFLKRSRISFVSLFESRPFARFLELRVIQSLLAKGPRKRVNLFRWNCHFFDRKLNRSIGHPRTNPSLSFHAFISRIFFPFIRRRILRKFPLSFPLFSDSMKTRFPQLTLSRTKMSEKLF